MSFATGCFGEYEPPAADTELPTSSAAEASVGSSTEVGPGDGSSSSTSSGAPICEQLDILIVTDVSLSMAPFATGIINVLLALGTRIEDTLGGVGTYNLALSYNVPPNVNEGAFEVPPDGEGCTQLGALVRGQDACVEEFDGRPFLTEMDDLGAGLTCLAGGLIGGQWNAIYETPRTLDSIVAFLENDTSVAACNAGYHQSPDPLLIILIVDSEDESESTVLQAVTAAVATQGTSLESIGVFTIAADASMCPDEEENECGALPACRVQEFLDSGFSNVGLGDNLRRFNICRSLEMDSAAVADDLLEQMSGVIVNLCG